MSLAFTALTACSDDNSETSLCDDVTCEGGICEKATGQCINPIDCAGDDSLCLEGFTCNVSTCEAEIACDNSACERGVCANGACINPAGCTTNANCLGDFYCGADDTCAADPCADTTCAAGVCQIGTGECVNADICTRATEATDCVSGSKCDGGQCVTEAVFCSALDCQRGVCSFEGLVCTNSDNCGGDDTKCLTGNYCADDNTCKANVCDALNQTCARGECDPASGQCVNPDTCTNADNCTDAFVCVGAVCVATEDACGAGGCAGNQICTYDDAASTATCGENLVGCSSALDCSTDRICDGGVCAAPAACVNDAFEPNDTAGDETNYANANSGLPVELALCGTDTDRISFITTDDPDLTGTLVAEVNILAADVGLGILALDLLNESGASVGTALTELNGTPTASARVEFAITATNGGTYTLVVSDGGNVSTAGVRYVARMDVVDADVVTACASPAELTVTAPVTGTTAGGTVALTSSCGDADGTNAEAIFSFTIDHAVYATFVVSPLTTTADFVISVRSVCEQSDSELGCEDALGVDRNESLERQLDAGTYIVVIEAFSDTTGGRFALSVSTEDIVCSAADNTCLSATEGNICNAQGTGFDISACPDGCDLALGICAQKTGDTCEYPIVVNPTTGYIGSIAWGAFLADYDPVTLACLVSNSPNVTDGPDVVYSIDVPDGSVLSAVIEQVGSNYISAYLVEDCADIGNTCLFGSNESGSGDETIFWHNDTGAVKTVFLVADSEIWSSYGTSPVQISVKPFVCAPGSMRCVLDRESQTCNTAGTGYDDFQICDSGCDPSGACLVTNDTCSGAIALTSGTTFSGTIVNYVDDYIPAGLGECSPVLYDDYAGNSDAVFSFTTTTPNEIVTITVDNVVGFDPIIWIAETCNMDDTLSECLVAVDTSESDGATEILRRLFPTPGTYFVVVEDGDSGNSTGNFDITALMAPPVCTPNAVLGCSADGFDVEYCSSLGEIATYSCGGGCVPGSNPSCVDEDADSCFDAEILTAGNTDTGTKSANYTGGNFVELALGQQGACDVTIPTTGYEHVYGFDLQPGEFLTIDVLPGTSSAALYMFSGECGLPSACEDFQAGVTAGNTFEYLATSPERVYFVVDYRYTSSTTNWNFNWDVSVTNYVCLPGQVSCLDANTASRCAADGLAQLLSTCPGGGTCADGRCDSTPTTADACFGAVDIGRGGSFSVDPTLFTSEVDIQSGNSCFSATYGAAGEDAFYQVTLQPNEILDVFAQGTGSYPYYQVVWAFTDCADAEGSCLGGSAPVSSGDTGFSYQAGAAAETVIVALDNRTAGGSAVRYYDVSVRVPDCLSSDPLVCNVGGTGLNTCVNGEVVEFVCGGGCAAGACAVPHGDTCFDNLVLTGTTGSIAGDWASNTNAVNITATQVGGCSFDSSDYPDGADDIYAVTLAAGETLKAELVASTTAAHMYIVGDCDDPMNTCLVSDPLSQSTSTIHYRSTVGETVFVIVDRDDTSTTGDYTLNYDITSTEACAPNTTRCLDANTVELCGPTGVPTPYTCASGCAGVACTTGVQADQCASAVDVGTGVALMGNYDDFTDDLDFTGLCAGETEDGPDAFYSVTLAANQIVRARLLSLGDEPPLLYFLNSCDADPASCIMGTHEDGVDQSDNNVFLEYQSLLGETVVIGVDNEFSADEPFFLTVEVLTPDCDPATFVQACTLDGTGFTYCNSTGFTRDHACANVGTCNPATNRCDEPVGDACLDPFEATPSMLGMPLTLTGTLSDFTNDYDLGTGNVCTLSRTAGPDSVYAVTLTAGQTLTATLVSDEMAPEDLALYVTQSCSNVRNQCLGGADNEVGTSTPELLTYTAAADGTYFVFVDSFYVGAAGDFTLNVTVN